MFCFKSSENFLNWYNNNEKHSFYLILHDSLFSRACKLITGSFLLGLTTVIGLKYVSPAKGNGKPTMKVKSLVSNEYKDLVELAALH